MFTLRAQQREAFSALAMKDFEDRMVAHLSRWFPAFCDELDEAEVIRTVREGLEKAGRYGIVSERGVCVYVSGMFAYGRDFDGDPALPWAGAILSDPRLANPVDREERLFEAIFQHLLEARGIHAQEPPR